MIHTQNEYQRAVQRLAEQAERIKAERAELKAAGLRKAEIKQAIAPVESFHAQLREEIADYERLRRGEFDTTAVWQNLSGMGTLLIRLRIATGLTQAQLADRLGVDPSQVSRDERNEYNGITMERATRILEALGVEVESRVGSIGQQQPA